MKCKVFRDHGLKITVEANTTKVNFSDIVLDLKSEKFYPYIKEGNIPLYVHKESNHPLSILKNNPESIKKKRYHQIRNASIAPKSFIKRL